MTDLSDRLQTLLADRYRIEREVGRGGMATVYLAHAHDSDEVVAVKVMHPELSASLGGQRFLREVDLGRTLQHPNIIGLRGSGEHEGLLYYVMPFIRGESLRDRLDRDKQLPLDLALDLTRQVAAALQYAHDQGVVHRDVKPENILLDGEKAIVADFGIARAVTIAGGAKLTQTGMAVGTPTYMSPEQAGGGQEVGPSADQYSLACVLYEMLAGQPPFTGTSPLAVMARHSLDQVPSLRTVRATTPDAVEEALYRALAKVPADRFPSIAAFADALTTPGAAGPMGRRTGLTPALPVAAPAARTSRTRWLVAAGAALVVAAGAGWFALGRTPAAAPAGPDPRNVAVLYFDDRSSGGDLDFLAAGITEALIGELSQVSTLKVISRNGVLPFRGAAVTPDSVGRALGVGSLVEGTVAEAGGELLVTVSMVNPATGEEVGSTRIRRPRQEIFDLQDSVVQEVAIFLRRRLGEEVQLRRAQAGTRNPAAWELFQQAHGTADGVVALVAAGDASAATRELLRADSILAAAERADPRWSRPPAERGWLTYRRWRLPGDAGGDPQALLDEGLGHAARALALDPQQADALELRGTLRYWSWLLNMAPAGDSARAVLAAAEADLRAAVTASPVQAQAWSSLSHLLLARSESAEAKLAAQRAYEADPYLQSADLVLWRLFYAALELEDARESARWCAEGGRRFPDNPRFLECRLWLDALPGAEPDIDAAWALQEQYAAAGPPEEREVRIRTGRMLVAMGLARAGLDDSARSVVRGAEAGADLDPSRDLALMAAFVYAILEDRDATLQQLGLYLAVNPQQRAGMAADQSWWFRGLRNDPRFRQLIGAT